MPRIWDAIVVGAGPAGTIAAERVASRGHRVLLLDAGPRLAGGQHNPEPDRRVWAFSTVGHSFDWYRVRAVGGRALLWGGWSYRFPDGVFRRGDWPYGVKALDSFYGEIERHLEIVEGRIDDRYQRVSRALGLKVLPKRAPMREGAKVWTPLMSAVGRRARPWTALLRLDHERGIAQAAPVIDLRDASARRLRARAFVLAASPIETTRILLESDLANSRGIGRGLVDHMVAGYVLLEPRPSPGPDGRGAFPGSVLFASRHERDEAPAFSIEVTGPLPLETFGIERMVPDNELSNWSATLIHGLGELRAHRRRYVDLDPARRDALERRVPRIHFAWSAAERRLASAMKAACIDLADELATPGSRLVPFVDPLQPGAGHEAGTCSMAGGDESVCDPSGRLRTLNNVWIADASAMPTAGDRHPTLTLLAHALRAADSACAFLSRA